MATVGRPGGPGGYVCGIDAAMDVIGGKWKVLILWALGERPCRFGQLRRQVPGVTEKVLASHLRELEDDGIVHREAFDEVPPHVEYSLTPAGTSLNAALAPLGAWGRENILGDSYRHGSGGGSSAPATVGAPSARLPVDRPSVTLRWPGSASHAGFRTRCRWATG
ncbi:winged helix-turn-helix transcriptional regulator [Nocardiopsis sediminis]|uniref:Winged helix-turn-helix transcriptional regulator n=1 Tax=Nocardiopsis sediminis TaxID=1778267 RepID=A0ABV8FNN6_9ACTN